MKRNTFRITLLSFLALLSLAACGLVQEKTNAIPAIPDLPTAPSNIEAGGKAPPKDIVQSPNPNQTPDTIMEYKPDAATELKLIQSAVFSMMADFEISTLPAGDIAGTGNATRDMTIFPGVKYHLYSMNMSGNLVNYSVAANTIGTYTVDAQGKVTQVTTGH